MVFAIFTVFAKPVLLATSATAFSRPPKGEIIANTTGGTRKYKGRLDTATTPPAEASGVSGAMPTVRKEEGVVLVRDRVRLVRSGRGVAG